MIEPAAPGAASAEGAAISPTPRHIELPSVLIVEHNRAAAVELIQALHSGRDDDPVTRHTIVDSLRYLHEHPLDDADVVIASSTLPDASGLDVLAFLCGARPELPVILTGGVDDAVIAREAIEAGALDFVLTTPASLAMLPLAVEKALVHQRIKDDNDHLRREVSRSLAQLAVKHHELETVIGQLETMARTDDLTGLANRRWLNIMLAGHWAEATRHDVPLAFMMIDLDGFKLVNDRLGHQEGDGLLLLTAHVLEANCRDVDIPARFGGDEFCVLMSHTTAEQACEVASRVHREFTRSLQGRPEPAVGMSIGIAHINVSRPVNAEQLLIHADQAMYAAKSAGKHCIMMRGLHANLPAASR